MDKYLDISITSAFGIEASLKRELDKLGFENVPAINGTFSFKGTILDVARLNMFLRTADRVYIRLARFNCTTFDELFDGVRQVDWQDYISKDGQLLVNGKCVNSVLYGISACQSITKKAIIVKLAEHYKIRTFSESGERYKINFSIVNNVCEILLDTSGDGLHKRGYRDLVGEASIKETLAAAILDLSVYNPSKEFSDPFCGSGTFPIEAALKAMNIAPGIAREFDFEKWGFSRGISNIVRKEARDLEKRDLKLKISGYDIDKNAIKLAIRHAERAGVRDKIHFQVGNALDFSSHIPYGVICTNPPYGERLSNEKEVGKLMQDFSKTFFNLKDWSLYLITSLSGFESYFGKKANKNRKLYNGKLECRLYTYLGNKPPKKKDDQI